MISRQPRGSGWGTVKQVFSIQPSVFERRDRVVAITRARRERQTIDQIVGCLGESRFISNSYMETGRFQVVARVAAARSRETAHAFLSNGFAIIKVIVLEETAD